MNGKKNQIIKISLCFFLQFLVSNTTQSQSKNYGEINYTYNYDISGLYSENYIMKFNDSISLSLETDIESSNDKNISISDSEGVSNTVIAGRKNLEPKFYFKKGDTLYFKDNYYNKTMVVKEGKQNWNWKLINEPRKIGQFICYKATTRFRGRNYTAWYTDTIPLPYGPWKLNGLPGLILEAYDDDGVFHLFATKVSIGNSDKKDIDFNYEDIEKPLSISQYRAKKVELIKEQFARLSSKLPKGSKPIEYNENCDDCNYTLEYFNDNQTSKD